MAMHSIIINIYLALLNLYHLSQSQIKVTMTVLKEMVFNLEADNL